jgi:hypothetical protein
VITLVQVDGGRYSLAFTWANHWFKKTVYFGDWVAAANTTLSSYYAAMSTAVDALAKKRQASDKQYKPQAYPQISQALREISRAVAETDIDKPHGREYTLVTDLAPAVKAYIITATSSAIIGTIATMNTYSRTGDAGRAIARGAWLTFQGIVAGFGSFMSSVAAATWRDYRGVVAAIGASFIC